MTTASGIGMRSRLGDGTPGLEFFKDETAFVWSGQTADPIEVSFFGYAEPVAHLIHLSQHSDFARPRPITAHAELFERVCEQWLAWVLAQEGAAEARIGGGETEQDTTSLQSQVHKLATGLYLFRFRDPLPQPARDSRWRTMVARLRPPAYSRTAEEDHVAGPS